MWKTDLLALVTSTIDPTVLWFSFDVQYSLYAYFGFLEIMLDNIVQWLRFDSLDFPFKLVDLSDMETNYPNANE